MPRYWLTPDLAEKVLEAIESGRRGLACSLDLGRTQTTAALSEHGLTPADGPLIPVDGLREAASARRGVFLFEGGRLEPIEIRGGQFYKVVPTDEAPTIEISGIQMHRTTGTRPFANAMESAQTVVREGSRVLDTCGGLGYTAIAAARLGAASVVSVEADPHVRAIARRNPWSAEYFRSPGISRPEGDVAEYVESQAEGVFDCVLHDPPRVSRAGDLYGGAFYAALARVLGRGGRMFHYTGEPYRRRRGNSFVDGVVRRLREAGFDVERCERLEGVVARRGEDERNLLERRK
jgi:hypothetical protein